MPESWWRIHAVLIGAILAAVVGHGSSGPAKAAVMDLPGDSPPAPVAMVPQDGDQHNEANPWLGTSLTPQGLGGGLLPKDAAIFILPPEKTFDLNDLDGFGSGLVPAPSQ